MDQAIGPSRRAKLTPDQQELLEKKNPGRDSQQKFHRKNPASQRPKRRAAVACARRTVAAAAFAAG